MAFTLNNQPPKWPSLTDRLNSFFAAFNFTVKGSSSELAVGNGIFAALVSAEGSPVGSDPKPEDTVLRVNAGDVGKLVFSGLKPGIFVADQAVNEFAKLYTFVFNPNVNARTYVDSSDWKPSFTPPLEGLTDLSTKLSHSFSCGVAGDRWAHRVLVKRENDVNQALTVIMPMLRFPVIAAILGQHTLGENKGYMPPIKLTTRYGRGAEYDWKYFQQSPAKLDQDVRGLVMLSTGRFQSLLLKRHLNPWIEDLGDRVKPLKLDAIQGHLMEATLSHPDLRFSSLRSPSRPGEPEMPPLGDGHLELLHLEGKLGSTSCFK